MTEKKSIEIDRSRYRDHQDRLDLKICGDCSTRATLCVVNIDEIPEHDVWHEAARLRDEWDAALVAHRRDDTDKTSAAEQTAHDALVDYIEANDLNETDLDPRVSR